MKILGIYDYTMQSYSMDLLYQLEKNWAQIWSKMAVKNNGSFLAGKNGRNNANWRLNKESWPIELTSPKASPVSSHECQWDYNLLFFQNNIFSYYKLEKLRLKHKSMFLKCPHSQCGLGGLYQLLTNFKEQSQDTMLVCQMFGVFARQVQIKTLRFYFCTP